MITRATGSRVVIGNFGNTIYGHLGEVDVYLGPIDVYEHHDRTTNEYIVQGERLAMAVWNTCGVVKQDIKLSGGSSTTTQSEVEVGDTILIN